MVNRVALWGFTDAERRDLEAFLRTLGRREPGYQWVHKFADSDLILADGDSQAVVDQVLAEGRIDTALFLSRHRPVAAVWHVPKPTDSARLLLGLDELAAQLEPPNSTLTAHGAGDARMSAKAAARRAARRARMAAAASTPGAADAPPDVLVLDADGAARDHLCRLLEQFGFCAYPARDCAQAMWLLDRRQFSAAFVDVPLDGHDGGAGTEICQRVTSRDALAPGTALAALFIVTRRATPADRVRAVMAGCHAVLLKPLSRGDVAGALDSCGIRMPIDARGGFSHSL